MSDTGSTSGSIRAQGRRKSNFPASTSVLSGATFDFVSNGVNYKITYNDLVTSLNVTGTITQVGDPLGTPVLETQGTVNNIRNLENGSGVKASVSAQNGITLDHNFANGDGGVDVVKDITLTQPIIRNIQAGAGMAVAVDDDTDSIILTATGETVASSTVTVSSEADLPAPVAGVITLAPTGPTDYLFLQDVTTANRFEIANACSIRSASPSMVKLTYSGSGDMFTINAPAPNLKFNSISVSCPSGTLFNTTSTLGLGIIQMIECNVSEADTLGTLDGNFISRFHSVAFEDIKTDGFTFTGAHSNLLFDTSVIFLNGGTFIDLGTATFNSVNIEGQVVETSAVGTTFLTGAASSANINANGIGVVNNNRISGSATGVSGITPEDALWFFNLNDDIADTRPDALLSMPTNATNSVISVAGTPVLVAGTWTVERDSQMTATTAGRATYNGGKDTVVPITTSVSIEPASGSNKTLSAYLAKNGTAITNSKRSVVVSSGTPKSVTILWQDVLATNDYYEVFVANDTDTIDVLVSNALFRVN